MVSKDERIQIKSKDNRRKEETMNKAERLETASRSEGGDPGGSYSAVGERVLEKELGI